MTLRRLIAEWLPESCPGCAGPTDAGFCPGCRADLVRPAHPPAALGDVPILVAFGFTAPLDGYVHALKFRGVRRLGRALGLLLAEEARPRAAAVDALVPVPLHPKRLRERGYNQAIEIARPVGAALGVPVLLRGIARRRATAPQSALGAAGRAGNVAHAFAVRRDLTGRRIAIVDDVVTTGATVTALAAALAAAGAIAVEAWAVAYTEPAGRST